MALLIPIIGFTLWILSIYLIRSWKYFWAYFAINFLILATYTSYTLLGDLKFMGQDEYGLGRLLLLFALPIGHTIIGFVIALVVNRKTTIANN